MANKREGSAAAGSPKKKAKPRKGQKEFLDRMMREGIDNYDNEGNPIPMRKKRGRTTAQPEAAQGSQEKDDDYSDETTDSDDGVAAARAAKKQKEKAALDKAKKDAEELAKPRSLALILKKWTFRILADGGTKGSAWPIFTIPPPVKPIAPTTNPDITVIRVWQMSDSYPRLRRPGDGAYLRINLGDASTLWVDEKKKMTSNVHMLIRDPYRDPTKRTAIVARRIERHADWLGRARAHHRYRTLVWEMKETTWEVGTLKTLVVPNKAHKNSEAKEELMARPTWEILKNVMLSRVIAGLGSASRKVPEGNIPSATYDIDGVKTAEPTTSQPTADPTFSTTREATGPGSNRLTPTTDQVKSRGLTAAAIPHRPSMISETRARPGISQAERDLATIVNGTGMSLPTIHISKVKPGPRPTEQDCKNDYGLRMNEAAKVLSEKAKKHTAEIRAWAEARASKNQRPGSV
ncbi:MAG: hypothetical protein M1823_005992 [Watsoniomyces obsoletus]|nr:MAG: hypothetical protein M1823_005992 [Watsoniomyces obsoletus]